MEHIKTQIKVIVEEVMLAAPEVREEAVQLYADLQVCHSMIDLWWLVDASEKLIGKTNAARQSESEGEHERR